MKSNQYYIFWPTTITLVICAMLFSCEGLFYFIRYIRLQSQSQDTMIFYVIGGSTSFGEPYDNNPSFSTLIKEALNDEFQGKKVEIKMVASPGKTLASNLYDFKKLLFLNPKKNALLLAYTGINDHVSRVYEPKLSLRNTLDLTLTGTILNNLFDKIFDGDNPHNSLFLYEKRLQNLVYWSNFAGYPVFLLELVGNLHDYGPDKPYFEPSHSQFKKIIDCENKNNSKKKILCFKSIIKTENLSSVASSHLSFLISWEEYKVNPSRKKLIALESFSWHDFSRRPTPEKNAIIKKVASENKNATFVPLRSEFEKEGEGILGYNLFYDAHHPRLRGIRIIVKQVLTALGEINKAIPSLEKIKKDYKIDQRKKEIILSRIIWFLYMNHGFHTDRLRQMKNYLDLYGEYQPRLATLMKYFIYPMYPVDKLKTELNLFSIQSNMPFSELQEIGEFFNAISKKDYAFERALETSFISMDDFKKYMAFLSK